MSGSGEPSGKPLHLEIYFFMPPVVFDGGTACGSLFLDLIELPEPEPGTVFWPVVPFCILALSSAFWVVPGFDVEGVCDCCAIAKELIANNAATVTTTFLMGDVLD